jgi:hypothetical protein
VSTDCTGGKVCPSAGSLCRCAAETFVCENACIPQGSCCTDAECSGGKQCPSAGAVCQCPGGTRPCGAACIAQASCCSNVDCVGGTTCSATGASCGCPNGRVCTGTCRVGWVCCPGETKNCSCGIQTCQGDGSWGGCNTGSSSCTSQGAIDQVGCPTSQNRHCNTRAAPNPGNECAWSGCY